MRWFLSLSASLLLGQVSATAAELTREMSTDRPDTTESPYTVPAGMFQVEMSFFDYSRDRQSGVRTEVWSLGQMNVKAGLTPSIDLQMMFDLWSEEKTFFSGTKDRTSGFGDVTLRLKANLWGNDEGRSALALMPYVTVPTRADRGSDAWAGGLIVPFARMLTDRISLGLMAQADLVHDEGTNGYDFECLHSATLGFSLTERLGLYTELVGIAGEDAAYQTLFDAGLTFALNPNLVFDVGVRLGLNRAAEDFGVFSGISFRF